jgi:hypothetical protein
MLLVSSLQVDESLTLHVSSFGTHWWWIRSIGQHHLYRLLCEQRQTQNDEARAALPFAKGVSWKLPPQSFQGAHLSRREALQFFVQYGSHRK